MNRPTSRDSRKYHGLGGTPTYRTWYSMIERCINPNSSSFQHYGARGISVCERWMSIEAFVLDMGLRPHGTTLDRIDLSRGYEPSNCRWADRLTQQRNRRNVKLSVEMAQTIRARLSAGATQKEVAAEFGLDRSGVSRIASGRTWHVV